MSIWRKRIDAYLEKQKLQGRNRVPMAELLEFLYGCGKVRLNLVFEHVAEKYRVEL